MTEDIVKFETRSGGAVGMALTPAVIPERHSAPVEIIHMAVQKGYSLDQLQQVEKMLELQKQHDQYEAEKAFYRAVAEFNKESPEVFTDKINKQYGGSAYSSLPNYLKVIGPLLAKHGLSVKFVPKQDGETLSITCVLRHELGHSESVTMSAPPDTSGAKNPIQQIKSTFTYLRVVTFESITGIAAIDGGTLDDDGNAAGGKVVEYISEKELGQIIDMINETDSDETKFLGVLSGRLGGKKIASIETIPEKGFDVALGLLEKKQKVNRDPGEEG